MTAGSDTQGMLVGAQCRGAAWSGSPGRPQWGSSWLTLPAPWDPACELGQQLPALAALPWGPSGNPQLSSWPHCIMPPLSPAPVGARSCHRFMFAVLSGAVRGLPLRKAASGHSRLRLSSLPPLLKALVSPGIKE